MKTRLKIIITVITMILLFSVSSCGVNTVEQNTTGKNDSKETVNSTEAENDGEIANSVRTEGIAVVSNGNCLIIENGSPISMLTDDGGDMFEGITTGDVIRITRDTKIMESFPAQVVVYKCTKVRDGDVWDIPEGLRDTLYDLGWIKDSDLKKGSEANRDINETVQTSEFTYSENNAKMSIRVPDSWKCEKYESDESMRGLVIYPASSPDNKLELMYFPTRFATCGTGLTTEKCTLDGKDATKMYYDGSQIWTYIVSSEYFALVNKLNNNVFLSMRDDIELMIDSIKLELNTDN